MISTSSPRQLDRRGNVVPCSRSFPLLSGIIATMVAPAPHSGGYILPFLEGGLTLAVCLLTLGWPRLLHPSFHSIERSLARLARRRRLAVLVVFLANLFLRVLLLPLYPVPPG